VDKQNQQAQAAARRAVCSRKNWNTADEELARNCAMFRRRQAARQQRQEMQERIAAETQRFEDARRAAEEARIKRDSRCGSSPSGTSYRYRPTPCGEARRP
jgi:hypothetical protein